MVEYKVKNKIERAPLEGQRVGGYYGDLMDTFFYERITSPHAFENIYKETEDAFKYQRDDEKGVGIWQGEYWGKWIISASRAARYNGSEELREFIRQGARTMMSYQRPDGYLGTYKNSSLLFPCTIEEGLAKLGYAVEWNWNIWCRKYTLWGMLEAYGLLGDEDMLRSARGMADYLINELDTLGVAVGQTGTFNGLASCSIMKPMLILYRYTGDEKYLNFCLKMANRWEDPAIMPGLIANSLSDKRIREWYPDSNKWAKAYEMMSCFDGIVELYRVTGEKKYFDTVARFFDMITEHESNILSSVAFNDVFGDAAYDVNCMTEPCDVIHYMRLAHELFLLTGDEKYMDIFESSAYNALFTSAFKDGKWGARALRAQGRHMVAFYQANMKYSHCCVNNMPRGLLNFVESVVMTEGDTLLINLYTDFEGRVCVGGKSVSIKIGGDLFDTGRVNISLSGFDGSLNVRMRIPAWSATTTVKVGANEYTPEAGSLSFTVNGASKIEAAFTPEVKVYEITSHPTLGDLPWQERRWISAIDNPTDESAYIAANPEHYIRGSACIIRKGPLLLCRSKLIGSTEEEMFGERKLTPDYVCTSCERIPSPEDINLAFRLSFHDGEKNLEYTVSDYCSGTNILTKDMSLFSVFF